MVTPKSLFIITRFVGTCNLFLADRIIVEVSYL